MVGLNFTVKNFGGQFGKTHKAFEAMRLIGYFIAGAFDLVDDGVIFGQIDGVACLVAKLEITVDQIFAARQFGQVEVINSLPRLPGQTLLNAVRNPACFILFGGDRQGRTQQGWLEIGSALDIQFAFVRKAVEDSGQQPFKGGIIKITRSAFL